MHYILNILFFGYNPLWIRCVTKYSLFWHLLVLKMEVRNLCRQKCHQNNSFISWWHLHLSHNKSHLIHFCLFFNLISEFIYFVQSPIVFSADPPTIYYITLGFKIQYHVWRECQQQWPWPARRSYQTLPFRPELLLAIVLNTNIHQNQSMLYIVKWKNSIILKLCLYNYYMLNWLKYWNALMDIL